MDKNILKILILLSLFFVSLMWGVLLFQKNLISSKILGKKLEQLNLLNDPTVKIDGTSLIGTQFCDFALNDLKGKSYQLSSLDALFKLIIIFKVEDCISCLNEYRLWSKLFEKYPKNQLLVIGICYSRDINSIHNFIKNKRIKFPVLWDPEKKVKSNMNFRKSPLRFLLDNNDNILDVEHTLTTTEHQLDFLTMVDSMIRMRQK